jgi:O-antigen ligase
VLARVPLRHPAGGLAHVILPEELALATAALALLSLCILAGIELVRDRLFGLMGLLAVFEAASLLHAPNRALALRGTGLMVTGAVMFLVGRAVASRVPDEQRTSWLWAPLMVPVTLAAGSVIFEAFFPGCGLSRSGHSPGGFLGERNLAAQFLVLGLPALTLVATSSERRNLRWCAVGLVSLSVCAIVLTRTRSAWLTAAVLAVLGLVEALRSSSPTRRARAAALVVAVAIALAMTPRLPVHLAWGSAHPYRDTLFHLLDPHSPSGAGRLVQAKTTLRMAVAHPWLGVGPFQWAAQYPSFAAPNDPTLRPGYWPTNRLPSDDLLAFLSERGWIAFSLALCFFFLLFRVPGPDASLRRALLTALALLGCLDAVLQMPVTLAFAAWQLGLTVPVAGPSPARARVARIAAAPALLTIAALILLAAARLSSFVVAVRTRSVDDLELASKLDGGDVALRLVLAENLLDVGQCDRALQQLQAVQRFGLDTPALRDLWSLQRSVCPAPNQ